MVILGIATTEHCVVENMEKQNSGMHKKKPTISINVFKPEKQNVQLKRPLRTRRSGGKHQMAACCACKKKRKKCDGKYPVCSTCERLGLECTMIYPPNGKEIKRDYLETLEKSVKELTSKLDILQSKNTTGAETISNRVARTFETKFSTSQVKYPPTLNKDNVLAEEVGFITLGAGGEPCYIGETSAYSIAKVISTSLTCPPFEEPHPWKDGGFSLNLELPFSHPDIKSGRELLSYYKESVHCQYPFLDWNYVEECFNLVLTEKSQEQVPNFFIYMIFAISSQLHDVSNKIQTSQYTRAYYSKAFQYANRTIESPTIYAVQAFLLIAVFSQKMPDSSSGWQAIGLAIRTAVILGLHRKPYTRNNEELTAHQLQVQDLKSRIFWSAYGIERINGLILGRPFSISDIDIDAPFPIESCETRVACHVIKLRRIQSNIYTFIYKPLHLTDQLENMETTRVQILLELNDWILTFPFKNDASSTFETNNWSLISYHNSILLLLKPIFLEVSKKKKGSSKEHLEWFKVFIESASAICINYKNMYLKEKMSFTWLAMHCCFVSGISFLYCIWLDTELKVLKWKRKSLIYETISACQTVLYVLAERWNSALRFRDTFERLSSIVKAAIESSCEVRGLSSPRTNDISSSRVFIEGSISIDSYLSCEKYRDMVKHIHSFSDENKTGIKPNVGGTINEEDSLENLLNIFDHSGDQYLRDLFDELEDNVLMIS